MSNVGIVSKIYGESYQQFGKEILLTQMRFPTLEAIFEVDSEVQRKLDPGRRLQIREFILQALESDFEFIFSTFVFSSRGAIKQNKEGEWELVPGSKLYIIDGQHRCSALKSAMNHLVARKETFEELGQFEKAKQQQILIDKLKEYPVPMQIYLNLDTQNERLLFTDLNTERRESHNGLIMQYDYRDKYAEITRNIASNVDDLFEIEQKLSRVSSNSAALTSLAIMKKCIVALFEGILTVKKGKPSSMYISIEDMENCGVQFFSMWKKIFPKKMENRKKYVSGLTGIQISLAYTVFLLRKDYGLPYNEAIDQLILLKAECNWSHVNPCFEHIFDAQTKKVKYHSDTLNIKRTAKNFLKIIVEKGNFSNDY
ncbi:DNA sulfur modification protein DndB [Bacillus massiliigorillae]|uniref:DNA sulfur modification protein DndB n=1 Tax=Bacillus massiliigorillae TaxID=1243664 RepID=UPI000399AC55|nr:DNA sulfur modification protein DndB [Bacillus massiliigorillae]